MKCWNCGTDLYRNGLKNREFDKEALQNFDLERATIVRGQGASEDRNFEEQPMRSKTDSSVFFGISDPPLGKLSFRETCDKCNAALHCCKNCRYYKPGLPNDCVVPGTEWVANREVVNFCEDFKLLDKAPAVKLSNVKKNFDDLFN